jgi:hypothetical protein
MNDKIIFVVTALARFAGSNRFQRTVVWINNPKVFSQ